MVGLAFEDTRMLVVALTVSSRVSDVIPVVNVEFDEFFVSNYIEIPMSKSNIQIFNCHSFSNRNVYPLITIGFKLCQIVVAKECAVCDNVIPFMTLDEEALPSSIIPKA